ncbi:bifunctional cytidylyltransferase/SDR family oxidoreductase [Marinifilum flexuosum]|jgi:2-C-methyl-D-erythritol 4-phosphate cytidylyltransferase|uniref:bifunctional cytidylyltransferase/SDR family oxidoreductase n=1 Tax=Marinifilum flexuosum TaxID=1117708 RepID=UPI0024950B21|nr:bifunctional cytidylyltransferase/SDR family oxidoreductase [Marinifilum flexuosum]
MRNIGVLLAGGNGNRLGANKPKQLIKVAGKSIIEHTIEVFQKSTDISEIAIVINPLYVSEIEEIVNKNSYNKVKKILQGGKERSDSSLAAIHAYELEPDADQINLVFHDAVRPFLDLSTISSVVDALKTYNAIDVAIPATDTIIEVNNDNTIAKVPQRDTLRRGQTPQGFKLKTIRNAYQKALNDSQFKATDDCGVVLKYLPEEPIFVVEGSETNIKVTYEIDMFIADKLFQLKHLDYSPTQLSDEQIEKLKDKVVVIFGGSYGIGLDIVNLLRENRIIVESFSRSATNTNVKNNKDVIAALRKAYELHGRIDYVINTAAILNKEPLVNLDFEEVREIIDVNYMGMINVAKESFKYLQESRGHLLLYTSSSYTRGRSSYSLYSSTKAAAVNFTQAIAEEWRSFGIRVNCINPERTKTPMRIKHFGIEPEKSLLKSEDVALVSLNTLLSDFTGQVIYVKK